LIGFFGAAQGAIEHSSGHLNLNNNVFTLLSFVPGVEILFL
jgi:hypothetical protein